VPTPATAPSRRPLWQWALLAAVVIAVVSAVLLVPKKQRGPATPIPPGEVVEGLPRRVAELLYREVKTLSPDPDGPVYVALRSKGKLVAQTWQSGDAWNRQALDAIEELVAKKPEAAAQVDAVELCLSYDYDSIRRRKGKQLITNLHRGVRGLLLRHGKTEERSCPTSIIARNKSSDNLEQDFRREHSLSSDIDIDAEQFEAHQLLVLLGDKPRVVRMTRGNEVVPPEAVNQKSTRVLAENMAAFLKNNVHEDGRMTYMYFPSRGDESTDNNMIRQYMASVALVRWGVREKDAATLALAEKNLQYNFAHFYQQDGDIGHIVWGGKSKLGSGALAALAIVEAPFRANFASYEKGLRAYVEHMQQPDGSFRTFYKSDQNDNQNFYPGEALLLWSTLYAQDRDSALLERIMKAFRYYRTWHRENQNPAFIPWHTQAYFRTWQVTKDKELADFVFEMNDWLLSMQEWDDVAYPDIQGRFHDPDRPQYGPPHASSTGVYLEGLIDAYRLAVALGDQKRAESYKRAIKRGLRSMMQQQFVDDVDMFYVSKREPVFGGIRTNVYDNSIRVDNVQHPLMGIMRIMDVFDAEGAW
jgi:hypothetical protein